MFSKRDLISDRNYYFLRAKQGILLLFCVVGVYYSFIKHYLTLNFQYGIIGFVALIALISLKKKQWRLFLLCTTGVVFNVVESIPPELLYVRLAILLTIGVLCLLNTELRYVKDNFGLTMFPPGWGTLRPQKHGSSGRFLSLWELATTFKWKPGEIFIGRPLPEQRLFGVFNFVKVGPTDNRHMLTIAGSQGGKGTAALIPNLLVYPGSVIAIDPKGELAKITAARRGHGSKKVKKFLGQDVFVFDPEHIVSGHARASWNPLAELDSTDQFLAARAEKIATVIVPIDDKDSNSEFFRDYARNLLIALILYVFFEDKNPDHRNLIYIRQLIMEGDQELYEGLLLQGFDFGNGQEALFARMETSNIKKIATTAKSLISLAPETRSSAIATLQGQTSFLDHPGMALYLQHSDFTLSSLKKRPTTIYLCIESLDDPIAKILSVFINMGIRAMIETKDITPTHRVLFILDEFYILGKSETIDKAMGLIAGYHVILWPIVQTLGQLKTLYPNSYQTFFTNCRGIQLFNAQEPDSLKWIEDKCGTKLEKRPDGSFERVPFLSTHALDEYFRRSDRRQIFVPQGSPPAKLELMDYYRFFPKNWYNDISDNDTPNPNPNQIIKLPNAQPVTYLPSPPPLQLAHSGTPTGFTLILDGNRAYKLNFGMQLNTREIPELNSMSPDYAIAEVCRNPNNPAIFGIKNLSDQTWKVYLPNGSHEAVAYGKSIRLADGCKISLGAVEGEINQNPFLLRLTDGRLFTLTVGKRISSLDIPELGSASSSGIVGEVCCNPNDPLMLGLKNLSNQNWKATLPDGNEGPIVLNKSLILSEGTRINFGPVQGEINN